MKLIHNQTGNIGFFIKEYTPTGRGSTTQIKLADGRIYFAPSSEFKTYTIKQKASHNLEA